MSEFKVLADFRDACGESPLWHPEHKMLYWTDITRKKFYCYDWTEKRARLIQSGFEICGFAFNEPDDFVVVNSTGIWLWDGKGNPECIAAEAEGIPCRMNDCATDSEGRLLTGSCFFESSDKKSPLGHLMLVDHNGSVKIVDEGIHLANGIGFSPDGRTLYFADSIARIIYSYDYNPALGSLRNRRIFVNVPLDEGLPDGITVDSEGFVWSAQWFGSCVVRYRPDGSVERRVPLPAKQITSLAFGGPMLKDIFVTSAELPDCVAYAPPSCNAYEGNIGGALYLGNENIAGKLESRGRIRPKTI